MSMTKRVNAIIVGGGQAGLPASYYLTQAHHDHVVLEQAAQAGNVWRNDRWDSFTLLTPNWAMRLPGAEYRGNDPDGFMPRAEIVGRYIQDRRTQVSMRGRPARTGGRKV
jgi:putative flavoprotein involved in K+ transport